MRISRHYENNGGFTLAEMMVAILIFLMVAASLVGFWLSAHKYMVNSFREHLIKNSANLAMRQINIDLNAASRVDFPDMSGTYSETIGNSTATVWMGMVEEVDGDGCFPISPDAEEIYWTVYCVSAKDLSTGTSNLYRYTGSVKLDTVVAPGCPSADASRNWLVNGGASVVVTYPVQPDKCGLAVSGTERSTLIEGLRGNPKFYYKPGKKDEVTLTGGYVYNQSAGGAGNSRELIYPLNRSFRLNVNAGM